MRKYDKHNVLYTFKNLFYIIYMNSF